MKRNEIIVGNTYTAKVSGKLTSVRVTADHGVNSVPCYASGHRTLRDRHGGFTAVNTATGREIHIRSAARLRRCVATAASATSAPSATSTPNPQAPQVPQAPGQNGAAKSVLT